MKKLLSLLILLLVILLLSCSQDPPEPLTIVALGDSLTEGYKLPPDDSYPAQLQQLLWDEGYDHITVVNKGISGDTSAGVITRLDEIIELQPDIVILAIGVNDIHNNIGTESSKNNIREIIIRLQEQDSSVILGGMQPLGNLGKFINSPFTNMYSDLAEEFDIPLISFFLRGVAGKGQYNIADGVHPNKEGYALIVEKNVWPVLEEELE